MSDSSIAGDNPELQKAYDTSWFGLDASPPSPSLLNAAVNGKDVTATDPEDPSKPAPEVVAANGGTPPAPAAVGIADTIGSAVSRFAQDMGVNTQMMQALFQQGKQAGAAQVADTLKQGQDSAALAQNQSTIEQAKTADLAAVNKLFLGDPRDPNSNLARSAAVIQGFQETSNKLAGDLAEKAKVGFFDDPGQWFMNKITSIGEQEKLDEINKNIVNQQTLLKNAAGLTTDIGQVTAAADATGLVEKGRYGAQLQLDKAQTDADAVAEKSAQTNISNLNTLTSQSMQQASLAIQQSRLQLEQFNSQLAAHRVAIEDQEAPLRMQQIQENIDKRKEQLQDIQSTNTTLQAGARVLGLDNPDGMTLSLFRTLPKDKQSAVLTASEGTIGLPGSPASALDTFNLMQPKNMSPPVALTLSKLRDTVAAAMPDLDNYVRGTSQGKQYLSQLSKAEQYKLIDSSLFATENAQIRGGPESAGPKGLYALPSISTALDVPTLKSLPLIQQMQPIIDADMKSGKQIPVKAQDFLDAASQMYAKDATPENLEKISKQVEFTFQSLVANRNAVNNYPALGLQAPNSYNATVDTKYSTLPGIIGSKQHIDMTSSQNIQRYLMQRKLADDPQLYLLRQ